MEAEKIFDKPINTGSVVKSKRIIWIDYAKTFGMFLVVWGHTMLAPPHPYIKNVIYAFHMPLFFFISGFLHKSDVGAKTFFKNCLKQLLIPFLFFNFLELFPRLAFAKNEVVYRVVWNFLEEMGAGIFVGNPPVGPSWFILCLLWMKILLWGCSRICKSQKSFLIIVLSIICMGWLLSYTGYIKSLQIFCIGNALLSFPFYAMAYVIKLNYEQIKRCFASRWILLMVIILFCVIQHYNGSVSLQSCNVGVSFIWMLLTGFSGILICIKVCSLFKSESRWVYTLSAGSIIILCTHGFILNITINKYVLGNELYSMTWHVYSMIGCALIMLVEYFIIRFFFRYLKWSVGGRKL